MALVKCPECGREKVSDSAEACPDCGYGVRVHFDKIKREESRKQQEQEKYERSRELEDQRYKKVPKPEKPVFRKGVIKYLIIVTFLITFFFIILPLIQGKTHDIKKLAEFIVFEYVLLVIMPLLWELYLFADQTKKYNLAQEDLEAYQKQVIKERDKVKITSYRAQLKWYKYHRTGRFK